MASSSPQPRTDPLAFGIPPAKLLGQLGALLVVAFWSGASWWVFPFLVVGVVLGRQWMAADTPPPPVVPEPPPPPSPPAVDPDAMVLREILNHVPYRVFWKDRDGRYLGCNRQFAQDSGLSDPQDLIGLDDFDMVWADQAEFYRSCDRAVMESGEALVNIEEEQDRPDGSKAWLLTSKVPLRTPDGDVRGMLGMYVDITDRKQLQLDLKGAKQAAEHANAAKTLFLANTSHEVRTPLNGIIGMLDLALDAPLPQEVQTHLSVARASAFTLLGIINDILDVTSLESSRMSVQRVETSVQAVLSEVFHTVRKPADDKGLAFGITLSTPVPETIVSDPTRLRQCLLNLTANAVKFTAAGSVSVRVRHLPGAEPPMLGFEVHDTGIGIPESALPDLFTPFAQCHGETSIAAGGVGLGLSITNRLVQHLDGRLEVTSTEGKGSCFTIWVPTGPSDESPPHGHSP